MNKLLKLFHLFGLILFLGSIFNFLLISILTKDNSLENLVFARQIISKGTLFLTLPGMWLIAGTGAIMTLQSYDFIERRWLNLKHLIIVLVIMNAHFVIVPAAETALEIAENSLRQGVLLSDYERAYMRESIWSGINVILVIIAAVASLWKFEKKKKANSPHVSDGPLLSKRLAASR
jgi:hypothetical protein